MSDLLNISGRTALLCLLQPCKFSFELVQPIRRYNDACGNKLKKNRPISMVNVCNFEAHPQNKKITKVFCTNRLY